MGKNKWKALLSFFGLAFVALILFSLSKSDATSLYDMELSQQARESRWIGRVVVKNVKSIQTGDFPVTEIQGEVKDIFKGAGQIGNSIKALVPGGKRDSQTSVAVLGLPVFREGLEYVLFLDADPNLSQRALSVESGARLVGWTAYRVFNDSAEQKVVMRQGCFMGADHTRSGAQALRFMPASAESYTGFVDRLQRELD